MPVSVRFSCPWCPWALDVPVGSLPSYPSDTTIQLALPEDPDAIDRKLTYHVTTEHPEMIESMEKS